MPLTPPSLGVRFPVQQSSPQAIQDTETAKISLSRQKGADDLRNNLFLKMLQGMRPRDNVVSDERE
jgi:hypothetical protein